METPPQNAAAYRVCLLLRFLPKIIKYRSLSLNSMSGSFLRRTPSGDHSCWRFLTQRVGGAQAVGIRAIWVNRHQVRNETSIQPFAEITELSELPDVLAQRAFCEREEVVARSLTKQR